MSNAKHLLGLARVCQRQLVRNAATSTEVASSKFGRMKNIQKQLQIDAVPVHLSGGFGDKALYALTWVLTLSGVTWGLQSFCTLAFK